MFRSKLKESRSFLENFKELLDNFKVDGEASETFMVQRPDAEKGQKRLPTV
jgi:hypothetical protein